MAVQSQGLPAHRGPPSKPRLHPPKRHAFYTPLQGSCSVGVSFSLRTDTSALRCTERHSDSALVALCRCSLGRNLVSPRRQVLSLCHIVSPIRHRLPSVMAIFLAVIRLSCRQREAEKLSPLSPLFSVSAATPGDHIHWLTYQPCNTAIWITGEILLHLYPPHFQQIFRHICLPCGFVDAYFGTSTNTMVARS